MAAAADRHHTEIKVEEGICHEDVEELCQGGAILVSEARHASVRANDVLLCGLPSGTLPHMHTHTHTHTHASHVHVHG